MDERGVIACVNCVIAYMGYLSWREINTLKRELVIIYVSYDEHLIILSSKSCKFECHVCIKKV